MNIVAMVMEAVRQCLYSCKALRLGGTRLDTTFGRISVANELVNFPVISTFFYILKQSSWLFWSGFIREPRRPAFHIAILGSVRREIRLMKDDVTFPKAKFSVQSSMTQIVH
jgi:hypothetical protein